MHSLLSEPITIVCGSALADVAKSLEVRSCLCCNAETAVAIARSSRREIGTKSLGLLVLPANGAWGSLCEVPRQSNFLSVSGLTAIEVPEAAA